MDPPTNPIGLDYFFIEFESKYWSKLDNFAPNWIEFALNLNYTATLSWDF